MRRRRLRLALLPALACLGLAFGAAAAPDDIGGWRGLSWGMTADQVDGVLPQATPLIPPWNFGPLYAERVLQDVTIGGIRFDAVIQMGRTDDRLGQILFERRPPIPGPAALQRFLADLTTRLGPPAAGCAADAGVVTRLWRFPSTEVALSMVDFSWDGSRGALRRMLLRYTPAGRAPASLCPAG